MHGSADPMLAWVVLDTLDEFRSAFGCLDAAAVICVMGVNLSSHGWMATDRAGCALCCALCSHQQGIRSYGMPGGRPGSAGHALQQPKQSNLCVAMCCLCCAAALRLFVLLSRLSPFVDSCVAACIAPHSVDCGVCLIPTVARRLWRRRRLTRTACALPPR